MKVSEAKRICPHFSPTRRPDDGKIACRYAMQSDMCRHDQHFLCDLKQVIRHPKVSASVSRIRMWTECQRKWSFRYVYRVDPPKRPLWAIVGGAFANARAKIDAGQEWELPDELDDPIERIKVEAVLKGYLQLPRFVDQSEVRVSELIDPDQGLWLLGYLDGITENRSTIYEWKYLADPSNYSILSIHMQAAAYLYLVPDAEMLILAMAKKPSRFKQKKTETQDQFRERLENEVLSDHKKWFSFKTFKRHEFDIDGTIDEIRKRHEESQMARNRGVFYPNYSACDHFGGCEWKNYCKGHVHGVGCEREECSHPDICKAIRDKREKEKQ